jgi:competence protein ComEA
MLAPALREAWSRVTTRVLGSRFAKPITRVVLAAAGLLVLAFIGKTAVAGAMGGGAPAAASADTAATALAPSPAVPVPTPTSTSAPAPTSAPTATPQAPAAAPPPTPTESPPRSSASADDPVILNTASVDELRRLPGVGEKRANAILALRTRLGRFRAVEDLLKVKGIGRATLKRLRPLVRLDPLPPPATASSAARR